MKNERNNEILFRDKLRDLGYYNDNIHIGEQRSHNPTVDKHLEHASKKGMKGDFNKEELGRGKPEYIIEFDKYPAWIMIAECKPSPEQHDNAEDEVKYYMKFFKEYNTVGIASSGETEEEFKLSTFFSPKNSNIISEIYDIRGKSLSRLHTINDYIEYTDNREDIDEMKKQNANFGKKLHNFIRSNGNLFDREKPLLVSAIIRGLSDEGFRKNYKTFENKEVLGSELLSAIKRQFELSCIGHRSLKYVLQAYSFIEVRPELNKINTETLETPLYNIIHMMEEELAGYILGRNFDAMSPFFSEFLNYSGGENQSAGIVPTPKHITELFTGIAGLTTNSVILELCAGPAGFLISSIDDMINKASSTEEITEIRKMSIIGIENDPVMYTLALANMFINKLKSSNLILGNCFDSGVRTQVKNKCDVGMINPPYGLNGNDNNVGSFIMEMMEDLKPHGIGIAIIPIGFTNTMNKNSTKIREEILKKHRLDAVMTLNERTFDGDGPQPCIMVFTAHVPHDDNMYHKTWLADWKVDGFIKKRNVGRIAPDNWKEISRKWIEDYHSKRENHDMSGLYKLDATDDWYPESYLKPGLIGINRETLLKRESEYHRVINPGEKETCEDISQEDVEKVRFAELFEFTNSGRIRNPAECNRDDPDAIPLISRKDTNNGIHKWVKREESFKTTPRETISFANMGVKAFVQPFEYYCSTGVECIKPKEKMSLKEKHFYAMCISTYGYIYKYGKSQSRKETNEMLLPREVPKWVNEA